MNIVDSLNSEEEIRDDFEGRNSERETWLNVYRECKTGSGLVWLLAQMLDSKILVSQK